MYANKRKVHNKKFQIKVTGDIMNFLWNILEGFEKQKEPTFFYNWI